MDSCVTQVPGGTARFPVFSEVRRDELPGYSFPLRPSAPRPTHDSE